MIAPGLFVVGDVVKLKSGGLPMTIYKCNPQAGTVMVAYFERKNNSAGFYYLSMPSEQLEIREFPVEALKIVVQEETK